jgi:hypothetical protein
VLGNLLSTWFLIHWFIIIVRYDINNGLKSCLTMMIIFVGFRGYVQTDPQARHLGFDFVNQKLHQNAGLK